METILTDEELAALLDMVIERVRADLGDGKPLRLQRGQEGGMATETADANETAERQGTWQLRRWCPVSGTHQDADWAECGWSDCLGDGRGGHRLRKRRMLICAECQQGSFSQKEFEEHECWSAY